MPEMKTLTVNGVKYDLRDDSAAPGGYGLGVQPKYISDCNTVTATGWYKWDVQAENAPFANAIMQVINRETDASALQIAYRMAASGTVVEVRRRTNKSTNTFDEWEWVNPPMVYGVEYRTTERWNGKAVYTMAVNFGSLPNNVIKQVDAKTNATCVLDIAGYAKNGDEYNPIMMGISGTLGAYPYALCNNNSLLVGVRSMTDLSMYVGYFIVKYTKD